MVFSSYVKFSLNSEDHFFSLDSTLPSSLATLKEDLFGLFPTAPGTFQQADVASLVLKTGEIISVLETEEDPDSYEHLGPYEELHEFLEGSTCATMVLREEPKTLDQLVECACDGELDDEWTREFLSINPELHLSRLKEILGGSVTPENCFAVIRLLLLGFPREKVKSSIEAFIEQTENVDLQEQATFLLFVFDNP